jgi:hypothetical protein
MKGTQDDVSDAEARRLKRRMKQVGRLADEAELKYLKKHKKR